MLAVSINHSPAAECITNPNSQTCLAEREGRVEQWQSFSDTSQGWNVRIGTRIRVPGCGTKLFFCSEQISALSAQLGLLRPLAHVRTLAFDLLEGANEAIIENNATKTSSQVSGMHAHTRTPTSFRVATFRCLITDNSGWRRRRCQRWKWT